MGTISMNVAGLPALVSLGMDNVSGPTACTDFAGSPSNYYVPYGETFQTATFLYTDSAGTNAAPSGYYSDGVKWRYWGNIAQAFTSEADC